MIREFLNYFWRKQEIIAAFMAGIWGLTLTSANSNQFLMAFVNLVLVSFLSLITFGNIIKIDRSSRFVFLCIAIVSIVTLQVAGLVVVRDYITNYPTEELPYIIRLISFMPPVLAGAQYLLVRTRIAKSYENTTI
jgi:hypothetical protein